MKRMVVFTICAVFVLMATETFAEEKAAIGKLGRGNVAFKIDYINFTDDFFSDNDDAGVYVAIEGYWGLTESFYLGGEIGHADNVTFLGGDDLEYMPVELNVKYVIELNPHFVFDLGGGVSYNRAKITLEGNWLTFGLSEPTEPEDLGEDWLLGGQLFFDLTYKINWFSIGLNGKYQITEDYKETDTDFSNYRWGLTIGFIF